MGLAPPAARAATPAFKVLQHTVTKQSDVLVYYTWKLKHLVDRGRAAYLGLNMQRNVAGFMDLEAHKACGMPLPPMQLATQLENRPGYYVEDLLCLDVETKTVGMLVSNAQLQASRYWYVEWDLASGEFRRSLPLAATSFASVAFGFQAIAFSPARRECMIAVTQQGQITVVGAGEQLRTVTTFAPELKLTPKQLYYDAEHDRALFVEYAELARESAKGYLVELGSGEVHAFHLPKVTYGVAFDPEGKTLYAYSAQSGEVQTIDLATGEVARERGVGTMGHALGLVDKETLLLVRNDKLHWLDKTTLEEKAALSPKEIDAGVVLVEGSIVLRKGLLLHSGLYDLFEVDFGGRAKKSKRASGMLTACTVVPPHYAAIPPPEAQRPAPPPVIAFQAPLPLPSHVPPPPAPAPIARPCSCPPQPGGIGWWQVAGVLTPLAYAGGATYAREKRYAGHPERNDFGTSNAMIGTSMISAAAMAIAGVAAGAYATDDEGLGALTDLAYAGFAAGVAGLLGGGALGYQYRGEVKSSDMLYYGSMAPLAALGLGIAMQSPGPIYASACVYDAAGVCVPTEKD